jgi:hypothetical protein
MVKKILLSLLLVMCFANPGQGADFTFPCDGGGTAAGDLNQYDPLTGALDIDFTFTNCIPNVGETISVNGTIGSSGSFNFLTSAVNIDTDVDITVTDGPNVLTADCTGNSTGIYNLATEVLDGTNTLNCSATGALKIDLVSLLGGLFAYLYGVF